MTLKSLLAGLAAGILLFILVPVAGAQAIATGYTNWDDITLDLMAVERKGNVLTIGWAVRNEGEENQRVRFSLTRATARTFAVDQENGTKYFVLTDEAGICLASECVTVDVGNISEGIDEIIDGGRTKRFWMKLPAPPPAVTSLAIFFDDTEPLEDVPITDE